MTSPAPTLRLVIRRAAGGEHVIDVGPGARIGRGAGADVRIPDEGVAAIACELSRGETGWTLTALAPGVVLDGVTVAIGAHVAVAAGADLRVGTIAIGVLDAPAGAVPSAERTASLARELVRELLAGPGGPELVVEGGPAAGKRLRMPPPEARVVVGRGEGSSWVVLDPDLSRAHAAIDRGWDGVRVVDLGSKNGTRVGGVLVPRDGEAPGRVIADGDVIELGATRIRYADPAEQYLRRLDEKLGQDGDAGAAGATATLMPRPAGPPWGLIVAGLIVTVAIAAMIWVLV
jgi:predicted component of type VI protein secretion system